MYPSLNVGLLCREDLWALASLLPSVTPGMKLRGRLGAALLLPVVGRGC